MKIVLVVLTAFSFGLIASPSLARQSANSSPAAKSGNYITREVRHELAMLPWYSIFDNLEYRVTGGNVTLMGQVVQPALKSEAEAAVKKIEGVQSVDNQIQILPPAPADDQIRRAEFHAIYGDPSLQRYAVGYLQAIHIIVDNGHVTLEGAVANQADKNVAGIRANTVPNVFSVTNNLAIQPQ